LPHFAQTTELIRKTRNFQSIFALLAFPTLSKIPKTHHHITFFNWPLFWHFCSRL
jgi:hypothetical protein